MSTLRARFHQALLVLVATSGALVMASGALLMASGARAQAAGVTIACQERFAGKTAPMTLVYDGDEAGTLTVRAPFGEFTIPATKMKGDTADQFGIHGSGQASFLMPEAKALDACIAAKKPTDEEMAIVFALGCAEKTPNAASPIKATFKITIGVEEPPLAGVYFTRTYLEKSSATGKAISLESVPPPVCKVASG